jgi:hypothetical protein
MLVVCFMFSVFSSNLTFDRSTNLIASSITAALVGNSNLLIIHSLANDNA